MTDETRDLTAPDGDQPARRLKFFRDADGNGWLCEGEIDPEQDPRSQGCWRCEETAFPLRRGRDHAGRDGSL
jgi:hypothetical protein